MNVNFFNFDGNDTFPTTLPEVGYPYNQLEANAIPTFYFEFTYRRNGNQNIDLASLVTNARRRIREFCTRFSVRRGLTIVPDRLRCDLDWGGDERVYGDHRGVSTPFFPFRSFVADFLNYIDNLLYALELGQDELIYCNFNLVFTLQNINGDEFRGNRAVGYGARNRNGRGRGFPGRGRGRWVQQNNFDYVDMDYNEEPMMMQYDENQFVPEQNINIPVPQPREIYRLRSRTIYDIPVQNVPFNLRNPVLPPIRYNLRSRVIRYVGAKWKETTQKIFERKGLDIFLKHSNALINVPFRGSFICFPMAFMKCQLRQYKLDENRVITDIVELKGDKYASQCDPEFRIRSTIQYNRKQLDIIDNGYIQLFNNYKKKYPNLDIYQVDYDEHYMELWEKCAFELHDYCQSIYGPIDFNNLNDVANAYANIFKVHVHIYKLSDKLLREETFVPIQKRNDMEQHVHILISVTHCFAVTNIRSFVKPGKITMKIFNYCDFCHKELNNNFTKVDCLDHINSCYVTNKQCVVHQLKELEKKVTFKKYQFLKTTRELRCNVCHEMIPLGEDETHFCYIKTNKKKDKLKNEQLYVLDIESIQIQGEGQLSIHKDILVCIMNLYNYEEKYQYETIEQFLDDCVLNQRFAKCTFIAHNGGGYDYLFLLQILEKRDYQYNIIPRPGNPHKMLQLTLTLDHGTLRFIDFIALVPGSLKNIAKSFGIVEEKSYFPYKWVNVEYEGSLIPAFDGKDMYCLDSYKEKKDVDEFKIWYQLQQTIYCTCEEMCICEKQKWNFKKVCETYCWQDVLVLGQICKSYREAIMKDVDKDEIKSWNYPSMDPFLFITQSQLALQIFLHGFQQLPKIANVFYSQRPNYSMHSNSWLAMEMKEKNVYIHCKLNHACEYYVSVINKYVCGFDEVNHTIYEMSTDIPYFTEQDIQIIQKFHFKMICVNERDYIQFMENEMSEDEISNNIIIENSRSFFFGGKTEVFKPYYECQEGEEIKYIDVCSLYPYVCAMKELPIGFPLILHSNIQKERLHPTSTDPYWGYAQILVECPCKELIGLLPSRDKKTKRLQFDLQTKIGIWHTEEIYFAIEKGYKILHIYQVYHWEKENRNCELFKGYVDYFLRIKQESEGWEKYGLTNTSSNVEKQKLIDDLYLENGGIGKMRIEKVAKNPIMRGLSKLFLNSLWGKLCQNPMQEQQIRLNGYTQFIQFTNHPAIDQSSCLFRYIKDDICSVRFNVNPEFLKPNNKYNTYIAASVTAHARTYLHRQMYRIGPEKIIYCDTDSIMYVHKIIDRLEEKKGLGNWVDEYPNNTITRFIGLAPKSYALYFTGKERLIKTKGISLTLSNLELIKDVDLLQIVKGYVEGTFHQIKVKYTTISPNSIKPMIPYGCMLTTWGEKILRLVISKRQIDRKNEPHCIQTVPYGYLFEPNNVSSGLNTDT
jgi:hypothetical protein